MQQGGQKEMTIIRKPSVSGTFYSSDPEILKSQIETFLKNTPLQEDTPKAIISPHAGFVYSGQTAAFGFKAVANLSRQIKKVVVVGPSHRFHFHGLATTKADFYETPLGNIPIDKKLRNEVLKVPHVNSKEEPFDSQENSLETQFPFLQVVLDKFTLLPLLVGEANADEVAEALRRVWGKGDTLIVISSDLSHYYDYSTARSLDKATAKAVLELRSSGIGVEQACGRIGMQALLIVAKEKKLIPKLLDLRNSGDMGTPKTQVVGYTSFIFCEEQI